MYENNNAFSNDFSSPSPSKNPNRSILKKSATNNALIRDSSQRRIGTASYAEGGFRDSGMGMYEERSPEADIGPKL